MPGSDARDLAETLVSLSGQSSGSPSRSNSSVSVSLGGSERINHLILTKDGIDGNLLLEESVGEVDLLLDGSSVDLDLEKVSLLLVETDLADLSVSKDSNDGSDSLQSGDLISEKVLVVGVLLGVLGEGFLLGSIPVLVESSLDFVAQMSSPYGGDGSESLGGGNVSNDSDNDHGGSLEDGDSLDDLLLVDLGSELVYLSNDVSASSLVAHKGSEMNGL